MNRERFDDLINAVDPSEDSVTVLVDWDAEFGDGEPPAQEQQVPQWVFDNALSAKGDELGLDDVAEWLTDTYDFLVKDWVLKVEADDGEG